jgi:hypothetical protein
MLAARWLGLGPAAGKYFFLGTAALSIVGYHHGPNDPVIRLWNDCSHGHDEEDGAKPRHLGRDSLGGGT